jgi:hypothetical protein
MLWTIILVLIVLWLMGMVTSYTMGGLIHILLVIAIIVVLVRVIQGRKVL